MLKITKNSVPPLLVQYSQGPDAEWDGPDAQDGLTFTQVKEELRAALVREQHGLCAYCMRRIHVSRAEVRIEHVVPRSACEAETLRPLRLDYSNLLACCSGRIGEDTCCDVRKDDCCLDSHLNVAASDFVEERISYEKNGTIRIDDARLQHQIDKILHLNAPLLKANRKRTYEGFCLFLKKAGRTTHQKLVRKLVEEGDSHSEEWPEYWGCRRYFMMRKLRRLE